MSRPIRTATRPPASALPMRAMRVVVASLAIGLLPTFLIGALSVPISNDLDVGAATIGATVSAFFLAAALSSVPAGRQVDRRGAAFGYRTGLTGVGLTAGTIGLLADAGWHLIVAFAVAGMSLAFVDPSITRTITGSVGWRRHGIAFGIKESAVPSASMVAGITLPLLGSTVGWQVPFLVVATLALGLAALVPSSIEVADAHRSFRRTRPRPSPAASRDHLRGAETVPSRAPVERSREGHAGQEGDGEHGDEHPGARSDEHGGEHTEARSDEHDGARSTNRGNEPDDQGSTGRSPQRIDEHSKDRGNALSEDRANALSEDRANAHSKDRSDGHEDGSTGPVADERGTGGLALLAIGSGLGGGAGAAVATFIVPTGIVIGMGAVAAGLVLSIASLGSIGVRLGAGWLVDRRPQAVLDLLVALLGAGLVGGVALAAAAHLGAVPIEVDAFAGAVEVAGETEPAATEVVVLLVVGAMLLLGPGWGWTGLVFLTATRLTPDRPAQASGAILAGLGGGGALFPLGAGWLAESVGFGWTWTVVAFAMSLSVILMLVVRAKRR